MGFSIERRFMMLKHLPNALTFFRLILIIPFLYLLHQANYSSAFYVYVAAGITDALDGWLARYYSWQSRLGSFIDPLADKLLIALSFIALALLGRLPWWLVGLVFMRDLTISIGIISWYLFIKRPIHFEPTVLSKINTVLQLLLVTVCLFHLAFFDLFSAFLTNILLTLTVITTSITYFDYVWTWSKKACFFTKLCRS